MANREFLMLAHNFDPARHGIGGWFLSEKLDGQRCWWDGGITRGIPKSEIPWANTKKDERYVDEQICTGLWSRYGNVIHAPEQWLDDLPAMSLDGELYMPDARQNLMRVIRTLDPDPHEWDQVHFHIIDRPPHRVVLSDGVINNPNFSKTISWSHVLLFAGKYGRLDKLEQQGLVFEWRYKQLLKEFQERNRRIKLIPQMKLPVQTKIAEDIVYEQLERITDAGGEGLILRNPTSVWVPKRDHSLVKVKKLDDSEGTVIGYVTGKGKLTGLMGALIVDWNGKRFELSGFTDEERTLNLVDGPNHEEARQWAEKNQGKNLPTGFEAKYFPRGTVVTFRYRQLTLDGMPQEARYWRKHVKL